MSYWLRGRFGFVNFKYITYFIVVEPRGYGREDVTKHEIHAYLTWGGNAILAEEFDTKQEAMDHIQKLITYLNNADN